MRLVSRFEWADFLRAVVVTITDSLSLTKGSRELILLCPLNYGMVQNILAAPERSVPVRQFILRHAACRRQKRSTDPRAELVNFTTPTSEPAVDPGATKAKNQLSAGCLVH